MWTRASWGGRRASEGRRTVDCLFARDTSLLCHCVLFLLPFVLSTLGQFLTNDVTAKLINEIIFLFSAGEFSIALRFMVIKFGMGFAMEEISPLSSVGNLQSLPHNTRNIHNISNLKRDISSEISTNRINQIFSLDSTDVWHHFSFVRLHKIVIFLWFCCSSDFPPTIPSSRCHDINEIPFWCGCCLSRLHTHRSKCHRKAV